jgi:hypothetical protein
MYVIFFSGQKYLYRTFAMNFEDVEDAVWGVPLTITKHFTPFDVLLGDPSATVNADANGIMSLNISLCVLNDLDISDLMT